MHRNYPIQIKQTMTIDQPTKEYIDLHRQCDVRQLALQKKPADVDHTVAIQQIAAWQAAKTKIPLWAATDNIIFPPHLSLEQCSSQNTARFKSDYIAKIIGRTGWTFADLTGGFGIDCTFFAQYASAVHYVEANSDLCAIAQHNFETLKKSTDISIATDISVHNLTAEDFIELTNQHFDLVYLDPARRGQRGEKLVSVADCQPNAIELQDKLHRIADWTVIKLSPMLDITKATAELNNVREILIISSKGECKELLLIIGKTPCTEPLITAVEITDTAETTPFQGLLSEEKQLNINYSTPLNYLYEPHPAHLKSGLFKTIAHHFGVAKISQHAHLYTSNILIDTFPGRIFEIEAVVPFDKRQMKQLAANYGKANISTRHFPLTADQLHRQYKIKDGGNTYLFATTTATNNRLIIVCRKPAQQ